MANQNIKEKFKSSHVRVYKRDGVFYVEAKHQKYLCSGRGDEAGLEDATITVYDDNTLEIEGTQIYGYWHTGLFCFERWTPEDAREFKLIFTDDDIIKTWFGKEVMVDRIYEESVRRDYRLVTNVSWVIKSSNGELLSSEELA